MTTQRDFETSIDDTDYGFIVCSKTGKLKGIWIPEGSQEQPIPQSIVDICIQYFKLNPNEQTGNTIH